MIRAPIQLKCVLVEIGLCSELNSLNLWKLSSAFYGRILDLESNSCVIVASDLTKKHFHVIIIILH